MPTKTRHATTNDELEHYMKVAGVRPVEREANWKRGWSETIRERVAYYCAMKAMVIAGRAPATDLPRKPQVLR